MQAAARASARRRAGSSRRGLICLLAGAAGGGGAKVCGAKVVEQVLVWWVKCLECGAACGRARPCVARRVVDADVSAELGICGARSAEQYMGRASVEVAARARERGMVPVPVKAGFFSRHSPPCPWRKCRDIPARYLPHINNIGVMSCRDFCLS